MRLHHKIAAASLVVASVVALTGGTAFATDCFNASRSAQGDTAAATNSGNWWSIPEFLAMNGLTPSQIQAVMVVIDADPRVPANFTVFFNPNHPMELAGAISTALASNGRGIDHSDDYSTPVFDAIVADAMSVLSGS